MGLSTYKEKRKFDKTPEPKGTLHKKEKVLRFVVQKHHASHLHYDFRLEMEGVLKSWAVPKGPSLNPKDKRLAVMVEDHPYDYRNFEGVIPEGNYGAGKVIVWDEGTYEAFEKGENEEKTLLEGLKKGNLKFIMHGKKLQGKFALVRLKKGERNWLLLKEKDEFVSEEDIREQEFSVKTGKSVDTIDSKTKAIDIKKLYTKGKKSKIPHEVKPMLATLAEAPFNDENCLFEIKWDGYRAIAEVEKGKIRLYSRNNQDFNEKYSEVVHSLESVSQDVVLDGEIVVLDDKGHSHFQSLQDYQKSKNGHLIYYVFDLLYINGYDIRDLSLIERKSILREILSENPHLKYSDHIDTHGMQLYEVAQKQGLEGIMAKKKNSTYHSVRSDDWQKIKHVQMQEAVICGFTEPKGQRKDFGALILGIYDNNELRYVGHTGGGFDDEKLSLVLKKLKPLITDKSPFPVTPKTNMPATWVKPKLVCQVKFSEWTNDGMMRQPIFLGLREDKKPDEVTPETPAERPKVNGTKKVQFSNLSKIYWPEKKYTKGDLIEYYDQISPYILPYLKDRPESLKRHPNGIHGEFFFQKDMPQAPDWAKTVPIHSDSDNKNIHWLICNDKETLLYMANLGCIEINPWNSRYQTMDNPDYLIIDLDPNEIEFKQVIKTAHCVKEIMDRANIESFLKTSGKKGLHILVPLKAKYTFDQTRQFAEILAHVVFQELPEITSIVRDPKKREKKVYIDFLQNRIGQTLAAPYCVRPTVDASVSTPLHWKELDTELSPSDFTIKNIFERLKKKGDIWEEFRSHKGINMLKSLDVLFTLKKK